MFLRKTQISWHIVQEEKSPGCMVTPLQTQAGILQGISSAAATAAFFAEPPRHFGFGKRGDCVLLICSLIFLFTAT